MIIFLRHAEPRKTELDPPLTSAGVRMARAAAEWVVAQLPDNRPAVVPVLHTATRRTAQTAAALVEWLGDAAQLQQVAHLPQRMRELDALAAERSASRPGLPPAVIILVGHHTTLVGLRRELADRTPAHLLPQARNHAAGVVLTVEKNDWVVRAVWPGHPT